MSRSPILRRAFGMLTDATRGLEGLVDCSAWHQTVAAAGAELDALERELDVATNELAELAPQRDAHVARLQARVADLEKERAGHVRTLEAVREQLATLRAEHAELRAELEARVEAHGRTSRELVDARASCADLDAELAKREDTLAMLVTLGAIVEAERDALEEGLVVLERELAVAPRDTFGPDDVVRRVRAVVQAARSKLDKRRGASAQRGARVQRESSARGRSSGRATGQAGGGSSVGALSASTPRKNAERARLPKLPPPALNL